MSWIGPPGLIGTLYNLMYTGGIILIVIVIFVGAKLISEGEWEIFVAAVGIGILLGIIQEYKFRKCLLDKKVKS